MSLQRIYNDFKWRIFWNSGQVPEFPNSPYPTEWTGSTMIHKGQIAVNVVDEKMWYCSDTGIVEVGGGTGGTASNLYERKSDYVHSALTSYQGYAISGSSQSDPVWVITKIVSNLSGSIVSSNQYFNQSWTNRYLL